MRPTTRCREYRDGRIGRYRTYRCRRCGVKFQRFLRDTLPPADRVCGLCRSNDS